MRQRPFRLLIATLALAAFACEPEQVANPDTAPPVIRVVFPTSSSYDRDGDGLADFELTWSDSLGAVDTAAVALHLVYPSAAADSTTNLLESWRIERLDDRGLVVHETAAGLLPSGRVGIEVRLADTSGNTVRDTIYMTTVEAALVKTLSTGEPVGFFSADALAYCPDDGRIYVTFYFRVIVIDPESLSIVTVVPSLGTTFIPLGRPLCRAGEPLWVTEVRLRRLDRQSLRWLSEADSSFASIGIAASRADPDVFYLGESSSGTIGVFRISSFRRERQLLSFAPYQTNIEDIEVMPGDAKLYLTYTGGGIWVLDPARDSVLKRISLAPSTGRVAGTSLNMVLTGDSRRLFVAVGYGDFNLVEIDTDRDTIVRGLDLQARAVGIDLSPDERRLFVTTQDLVLGTPSQNYLIDVATFRVLRAFPRPRPPDAIVRYDRGVLFRPDGKYIFVARDDGVDVYLHRPALP